MIEIRKTEIFAKWIDSLRDIRGRARIQARIERLAMGNPGDVKPVGEDSGLLHDSLYESLSGERSRGFDSILKLIDISGITLCAEGTRSTKISFQRNQPGRLMCSG